MIINPLKIKLVKTENDPLTHTNIFKLNLEDDANKLIFVAEFFDQDLPLDKNQIVIKQPMLQVKSPFTAIIVIKKLVLLFGDGKVLHEFYIEDEGTSDAMVYEKKGQHRIYLMNRSKWYCIFQKKNQKYSTVRKLHVPTDYINWQ